VHVGFNENFGKCFKHLGKSRFIPKPTKISNPALILISQSWSSHSWRQQGRCGVLWHKAKLTLILNVNPNDLTDSTFHVTVTSMMNEIAISWDYPTQYMLLVIHHPHREKW